MYFLFNSAKMLHSKNAPPWTSTKHETPLRYSDKIFIKVYVSGIPYMPFLEPNLKRPRILPLYNN